MSRGRAILLGALAFGVFLGLITWLMFSGHRKNKVEVCMSFQGRSNCATASAATSEEAFRAATDAACTLISGGVTDTQACARSQPVSVRW